MNCCHCSSTRHSPLWLVQPPWWHCTITWLPALVCLPCWLALWVLTACDGALLYLVHSVPHSTAARGPRSHIMLHHTEPLCTSLLHRLLGRPCSAAVQQVELHRLESAYNAITVQPRYTPHKAQHHLYTTHTYFYMQYNVPSILKGGFKVIYIYICIQSILPQSCIFMYTFIYT